MPNATALTERQQKWFAAIRGGLEQETGRSLADWIELARVCPETAHRKRLAWMKAKHGLGQNRASIVLQAAFPPDAGWSNPETLADTLWANPTSRAVKDSVHARVMRLPDIVVGQRKGFTAYSRNFQFCALRPTRGGAILGLALDPATDPTLQPPGRHSWSERLLSALPLPAAAPLPAHLDAFLEAAWARS